MIRDCKACGRDYRVPAAEQDWCAAQGVSLPRRCPTCRAERRGVEDRSQCCSACSSTFDYPREFGLLVSVLGLPEPTRCPAGCGSDAEEQPKVKGKQRALANLWSDMYDPLPEVQAQLSWKPPTLPEDLFRDDLGQTRDDTPESLPVEGVPSPDSLFEGLGGPPGKAKG